MAGYGSSNYELASANPAGAAAGFQNARNQRWRTPPTPTGQRGTYLDRDDPMSGIRRMFSGFGGTDDFMNPRGNPYMMGAVRDQIGAEGAARQRGAGLRARRSSRPGMAGYATLMAELGNASDMSRGLTEANLRGISENSRNRKSTFDSLMQMMAGFERGQQGFEMDIEKIKRQGGEQRRIDKANRKTTIGMGDYGFSF